MHIGHREISSASFTADPSSASTNSLALSFLFGTSFSSLFEQPFLMELQIAHIGLLDVDRYFIQLSAVDSEVGTNGCFSFLLQQWKEAQQVPGVEFLSLLQSASSLFI